MKKKDCMNMVKQYMRIICVFNCVVMSGALHAMTINQSGVYPLTTNISGDVVISANNAVLDLQGFTISGGTYGVRITGNNCTVHSGIITGAIVGLQIESNNNEIYGLDLISNGSGMRILNGNNNLVHECHALQNSAAGFRLVSGQNNRFVNCTAIGNGGAINAYGFVSQDGIGNIFENCLAENTATTGLSPLYAAGFALTGTEQKSVIIDCMALNASGALNYGMLISGTVTVPQNNVIRNNQASGNSIGYSDDFAVSFTTGTNLWLGNLSNNNTTNFSIGTAYPISAAIGTGVGQTENIDGLLSSSIGGPAERIERTIVDQVQTPVANVVNYYGTPITGSTTLSSDSSYYLSQSLTSAAITISGSNYVTLDLRGNTIKNIVISNSNFLMIKNGRVYPNSSTTDAISITNSGNILLDSLDMISGQTGLVVSNNLSSDSSLMVRNCNFYSNSSVGANVNTGVQDYFFNGCYASNNGREAFYIKGSYGKFLLCNIGNNLTSGATGTAHINVVSPALGNLVLECVVRATGANSGIITAAGNVAAAAMTQGISNTYNSGFQEVTASTATTTPYWANSKTT